MGDDGINRSGLTQSYHHIVSKWHGIPSRLYFFLGTQEVVLTSKSSDVMIVPKFYYICLTDFTVGPLVRPLKGMFSALSGFDMKSLHG
jgi:hypothetical protein